MDGGREVSERSIQIAVGDIRIHSGGQQLLADDLILTHSQHIDAVALVSEEADDVLTAGGLIGAGGTGAVLLDVIDGGLVVHIVAVGGVDGHHGLGVAGGVVDDLAGQLLVRAVGGSRQAGAAPVEGLGTLDQYGVVGPGVGQAPVGVPGAAGKGDAGFRLMELFDTIKRGQMTTTSYEFHPLRPDGSTFSAFIHISPMITVEGTHLGWLWTLTDISEIRQAQERVTAAHERFTRVLESMQDAISVVDPQSNVLLFSNTVYDSLFGETSQGHLQAHMELINQMGEKKVKEASDMSSDIYLEDLDRWFDLHERTITWTDRTAVRLQILSDITERRKNENLLVEQQARSELNSRLVTMGEMASSLAHELNQPLTAISNYAFIVSSLMKKAGVPEEHEMFYSISRIEAQAQRAAAIIQRIRSFTKRSEPKMESIPVMNLIKEVMELASIQARRHNAKVQYYVAPDITNVWCDEIMIEQVLLNLIKNGIEASVGIEGQKPEVTLTVYSGIDHHIIFEVADNGVGIDDEHKAQLFDPFFTTKSTGMGMGLNICRTIVELHHGRLTISDNIGRGTIFTLTLPSENKQTG